jgi:hypothetical protein
VPNVGVHIQADAQLLFYWQRFDAELSRLLTSFIEG